MTKSDGIFKRICVHCFLGDYPCPFSINGNDVRKYVQYIGTRRFDRNCGAGTKYSATDCACVHDSKSPF